MSFFGKRAAGYKLGKMGIEKLMSIGNKKSRQY
jgi:hypothetical protein